MLLATVRLRQDHDGWPAGTVGAVVETFGDVALVEIVDGEGCTLAMLDVPHADLVITRGAASGLR